MKKILSGKFAEFLVGCAPGILLFLVMYGPYVLDPGYIDWCILENTDTGQHFIGIWAFLSDKWRWPLGLFRGLSGVDPACITVIDGVPIMALTVKLLRGARPEPFQYLGIWGAICFALQGGMGMLLMRRFTRNSWAKLAGTFFLLLSVPFLTRYPLHTALSSHFLILWALYLALGGWSKGIAVAWTLLVFLSSAIHPYLAAMCIALYLASAAQALAGRRATWGELGASLFATFALTSAALWISGVFSIGMKSGAGVFGQSQINLNGLVNPVDPGVSKLVMPMPCQLEAENIYLGAGLFILLLAGLPALSRKLRGDSALWRRYGIVVSALIAMLLFSVNCRLYLGKELLATLVLPPELRRLGGTFRAAGRFVWPAWYMLAALLTGLAAARRNKFLRTTLLGAAVLFQLYDLGFGVVESTWSKYVSLRERKYVSPYEAAVPHLGNARKLSFSVSDADFGDIGYFALRNRLAADDYYFARDFRRTDARALERLLDDGVAEDDRVYLLLPEERKTLEERHPELKSRILTTCDRSVLLPRAIR